MSKIEPDKKQSLKDRMEFAYAIGIALGIVLGLVLAHMVAYNAADKWLRAAVDEFIANLPPNCQPTNINNITFNVPPLSEWRNGYSGGEFANGTG